MVKVVCEPKAQRRANAARIAMRSCEGQTFSSRNSSIRFFTGSPASSRGGKPPLSFPPSHVPKRDSKLGGSSRLIGAATHSRRKCRRSASSGQSSKFVREGEHAEIVGKLEVPGLHPERQRHPGLVGDRIEKIERLDLGRSQAWHVREALRGLDIAANVPGGDQPLEIRKHGHRIVWVIPFVFATSLAAPVYVERLIQFFQEVGTPPLHHSGWP